MCVMNNLTKLLIFHELIISIMMGNQVKSLSWKFPFITHDLISYYFSILYSTMKLAGIIICFLIAFTLAREIRCQELTQSIRGKVVDKDSQITLPGASLIIAGSNPQTGTTTDRNGEFNFGKLPVGRYDVLIYYLGYETSTITNILLSTGKEAVLLVELTESVVNLEEIVVEGKQSKSEPINKMATVSAMKFNVEESRHYAGTMNDAARMVSSFAGIAANPSGMNDIIIRGNSPRGMLWRLEGIDIPNPNHFAEEGSSSGGISILNGAVLDNSDFFTGAFPAEYGNAYSGIFDMALRNGNNQKREYSIQAGFVGVDCTLEGPFHKKNPASYLFNYRYSTLAMIRAIGINLVGDAVPDFQDVSFKIKAPTKRLGIFTLFGIGGISKVHENDDSFSNDYRTDMGVLGLKNTYFINEKIYIKSFIAYTASKNKWDYKKPDQANTYVSQAIDNFIYQTTKASIHINKKFNARNVLKAGAVCDFLRYDLFSDRYNYELNKLVTEVNHTGSTTLLQSFVNWKHRFNDKFTLIGGIHSMYLFLNGNFTLEPRLGLKWQFMPSQTFNLGFGIHSKMESLSTYFAQQTMMDGSVVLPNKNLDFTKAGHFVIGYENLLDENLFLKVELYYQYLYNVPVEDIDTSSFSALNYSFGYTNRNLVNTGTGRNIGLEITVEKYFFQNYFFLITASLFDSKYKASDDKIRNTRYNGNYVFNVLGGKDFNLGKIQRKRILSLNLKGSWGGGQRTTPIDIEQSEIEGYTVRDESLAFSEQWDDFIRIDFKVSLSRNRKKATHTIELDIQNITNQLNVIGDYYDTDAGRTEIFTQMGFVPVFSYRVEF